MEQLIYDISLIGGGVANILLALWLLLGSRMFRQHTVYYRSRLLTALWLAAFGVGYTVHATLHLRSIWPSAASALTCSYFHIGAICFCWGFVPLLNPEFLTRRIAIRDSAILLFGILAYWAVALLWDEAPLYTSFSFCIFFAYAIYVATTFYRNYNHVTSHITRLSFGSFRDFVKWMQVCCDCIVAFGFGSVLFTAIFPTSVWPYSVLMVAGTAMFAYIAYSVNNYGKVVRQMNAI